MSELLAIIDAYKETHGQPSDASIARAVGIAPQTLNSWRKRGIRELPARESLQKLSQFMNVRYIDVLDAVLIDTGYMERPEPDHSEPEPERRVRGA